MIPIVDKVGDLWVHVEASPSRGMATIWDADIMLWAGSQLVEARAKALKTSPWLRGVPHQMLTFMGRGPRPDPTTMTVFSRRSAALKRPMSPPISGKADGLTVLGVNTHTVSGAGNGMNVRNCAGFQCR